MAVQTPMQRQYFEIKKQCRENVLLFFRLGDFYELFYEDAKIAAAELGLTLTARHKKSDQEMPMCGVPHHSADKYIARLTKKGFSIAICDQVSDPSQPGIVQREIVQIVTPGTTLQDEVLDERKNNFLAGIVRSKDQFALACVDMSTGEFRVSSIRKEDELMDMLYRFRPSEIVTTKDIFEDDVLKERLQSDYKTITKQDIPKDSKTYLLNYFEVKSLNAFGIEKENVLVEVCAMVLSYIDETQKSTASHINTISRMYMADVMYLDPHTIRNLELFETMQEGLFEGSLLSVLDQTYTSAGSRLLRKMLIAPLISTDKIDERLDIVSEMTRKSSFIEEIKVLKQVLDIERILAKVSCSRANPRDILALKESLKVLPQLNQLLKDFENKNVDEIGKLFENVDVLSLTDYLDRALNDDASILIQNGNIIKEGFNEELDRLRKVAQGGKEWLVQFEEKQKEETGISTLKVGYNKVFGYYIEISKGQSSKAPEAYIRKQTLTNAERYISPELKEYEDKILEADEKLLELEVSMFREVCEEVIKHIAILQQIARAIAEIDVYANFARISLKNGCCRPEICDTGEMYIKQGRHPVIEKMLPKGETFVPNDASLKLDETHFALITGPNMAGKSTYLRQNALITLMAQIGCFVPAEYAKLSIVDRIFTRIGASDNVSKGQSTFMVEMQETAHILHHATPKSLIILDEVGRGTSTYDGLALAWAIFDHLHDKVKAKTLFATHYHELISLAEEKENAKNLSVTVVEKDDRVIFLHSVVEGGADRSYGIEVAKLAGIPSEVIKQAESILRTLETKGDQEVVAVESTAPQQISFLPETSLSQSEKEVLSELENTDVNSMTPMEALKKLDEMKSLIKKSEI